MLSSRHRRAIRLAAHFIAPYRWQVLGALLALIVTAGITLSMGQGIRLLVDKGFMTQSAHLLNQSIGFFLLLVLGLSVGTFVRFYLVSWIGERVVAERRPKLLTRHLPSLTRAARARPEPRKVGPGTGFGNANRRRPAACGDFRNPGCGECRVGMIGKHAARCPRGSRQHAEADGTTVEQFLDAQRDDVRQAEATMGCWKVDRRPATFSIVGP